MKGKLFIGTSGWVYKDWKDKFYPNEINQTEWLNFYAENFLTVELNNSFYHLPAKTNFMNWAKKTPDKFIFCVKVSRYITHIKRLKGVKSSWDIFLKRASGLNEKLGPLLVQFPPSFVKKDETLKRLERFLKYATRNNRICLEFRHISWFDDAVVELLKQFNTAMVIADSARYPKIDVVTADFIYLRMHGPKGLFSSEYSLKEMKELSVKVSEWLMDRDVYVYFNNDVNGYAITNARQLLAQFQSD